MSLVNKFCFSTDEERFHGSFDTIEEAIAEGREDARGRGQHHFWVGQCVEPPQPETLWHAADWLEHVSVQDEYSGDWAEGWDRSTPEQREQLEKQVRWLMRDWLNEHSLRPTHYNVDRIQELPTHLSATVQPESAAD